MRWNHWLATGIMAMASAMFLAGVAWSRAASDPLTFWQWILMAVFIGGTGVIAGALTWCVTGWWLSARAHRSFRDEMRRK